MQRYPGRKFIIGRTFGHENNGKEFWSYFMLVGVKTEDTVYITTKKRSPTTSRHCNYLKKMYPQHELVSQDELEAILTMRREVERRRRQREEHEKYRIEQIKAYLIHCQAVEGRCA